MFKATYVVFRAIWFPNLAFLLFAATLSKNLKSRLYKIIKEVYYQKEKSRLGGRLYRCKI
jgi:hypothetical protein